MNNRDSQVIKDEIDKAVKKIIEERNFVFEDVKQALLSLQSVSDEINRKSPNFVSNQSSIKI